MIRPHTSCCRAQSEGVLVVIFNDARDSAIAFDAYKNDIRLQNPLDVEHYFHLGQASLPATRWASRAEALEVRFLDTLRAAVFPD